MMALKTDINSNGIYLVNLTVLDDPMMSAKRGYSALLRRNIRIRKLFKFDAVQTDKGLSGFLRSKTLFTHSQFKFVMIRSIIAL